MDTSLLDSLTPDDLPAMPPAHPDDAPEPAAAQEPTAQEPTAQDGMQSASAE